MARLTAGVPAPTGNLYATDGTTVPVYDLEQFLHLHFSRFADCPICNLHIAQLRRRHPQLATAGVRQAVVFHSPAEQVRRYRTDLPFTLIADPDRTIYTRFGVSTSRRALLHPQAIRRLATEARAGHTAQEAHGGIHGLPADFLIAPDGTTILAHYGTHANDNLSIDDLLNAVSARQLQPQRLPH